MSDTATELAKAHAEVDERVSELDGAMRHLEAMISENIVAADELRTRLDPVLQPAQPRPVDERAALEPVDPRSSFVRALTEQAERVRDSNERLRDALDRLDV